MLGAEMLTLVTARAGAATAERPVPAKATASRSTNWRFIGFIFMRDWSFQFAERRSERAPFRYRLKNPRSTSSELSSGRASRERPPSRRRSVAKRRRALVADPGPHRDGALHLGPVDQGGFVELLCVEADRTHVVAATGCFVPVSYTHLRAHETD